MRKLLSMAVVMMMIALATTGCKNEEKKTDPTTPSDQGQTEEIKDNPIYNGYKMAMNFVGTGESSVIQTLTSNGFTEAATGTYMKYGESYVYQVTSITSNSSSVVYSINFAFIPYNDQEGEYKPMGTFTYVQDALHKIGSTIKINGNRDTRFWGTYNQVTTRIAANIEEFDQYVNAGNLNATNTVWLDNTLDHYDLTDEGKDKFIGMKMDARQSNQQAEGTTEFSITFNFVNNSLNQ